MSKYTRYLPTYKKDYKITVADIGIQVNLKELPINFLIH